MSFIRLKDVIIRNETSHYKGEIILNTHFISCVKSHSYKKGASTLIDKESIDIYIAHNKDDSPNKVTMINTTIEQFYSNYID